jgi:hypothetical protein
VEAELPILNLSDGRDRVMMTMWPPDPHVKLIKLYSVKLIIIGGKLGSAKLILKGSDDGV